jgi:hypothetical protein
VAQKFSENIEANSKFSVPVWRHEAASELRTHIQYIERHPAKFIHRGDLSPRINAPLVSEIDADILKFKKVSFSCA